MKKILVFLAILMGACSLSAVLPVERVSAAPATAGEAVDNATGDGATDDAKGNKCERSFLGFYPWYRGLTTEINGRCEVKTPESENNGLTKFVTAIVLNILVDLSLAVGYLAIGFIVYGGYLYIMAEGDPGKAAKGKKTLTAAVIGTAIALLANVIMNLIVATLTAP